MQTAIRLLAICGHVALTVALVVAICILCSMTGCCDDLQSARDRLKQLEAERQQAAAIQSAAAEAAIADQVAQSVSDAQTPEPDPISDRKAPDVQFESITADAPKERLPRAVLVCGQYCAPCLRMEKELHDLIGNSTAPIQLVQNWLANDLERWGITPGMQQGTPYLFVLEKDGRVHGLSPDSLACKLQGYQKRETVLKYLAQPEHGVSLDALPQPDVALVVASVVLPVSPTRDSIARSVSDRDSAAPTTLAAVLAAHLIQSSGQTPTEQYTVGGLFDFNVDVPETWKTIGAKILSAQKLEFPTAGISVDWSGPTRSFTVSSSALTISPPVKVTVSKWLITYSAALDGIQYAADLSSVTFLLTGAPDLQVNLK